MKGFQLALDQETRENTCFRKVLYTSAHSQLVLMSLKPLEEIGSETHAESDQFFRFESGSGKCVIEGNEFMVKNGDAVIIPAGTRHNIINTDRSKELKMYTLYAPAHHKDGVIHATKKEAEDDQESFDGVTTESVLNINI